MSALGTVIRNELERRVRDRTALVLGVVTPLAFTALISFAFSHFETQRAFAHLAVSIGDSGPVNAEIHHALTSGEAKAVSSIQFTSPAEARRLAASGGVDAALILPAGITDPSRLSLPITVYQGPNRTIPGDVARVMAAELEVQATTVRVASMADHLLGVRYEGFKTSSSAGTVADWPIGKTTVHPASYFAPAMAMVVMFFTVGLGARSVWIERRGRTLQRSLVSPAAPWEVVGGIALASSILGAISLTVVWGASTWLFGVAWGDPAAVLLILMLMVVITVELTILVASAASNEEQVTALTVLVTFVLALIGGNFVPIRQLPHPLQVVSAFTPNGWALRALSDLVALGGGIGSVHWPLAVLCGFAVGLAVATAWRLQHWALP